MKEYDGFYNKLNTSQNSKEIYKGFLIYREEVTRIIMDVLSNRSNEKIRLIVFGAGNLMDVDYKQLVALPNVEHIQITDIDYESMKKGLEFLELDMSRIKAISFNYLGDFVDSHLNLLINQLNLPMISPQESLNKVEAFFENILKEFKQYSYSDNIITKGDIVLVLPIYTQLLYLELVDQLQNTKGYKYIQEVLLQKMVYIIDEFNKKLINCVKDDGHLIVLSDIIEENSDKNGNKELSDEIKEKIETYEKTYGVGLGSFGLLNICEYATLVNEYYINWDFNETKRFLVKGLLLKNLDTQ